MKYGTRYLLWILGLTLLQPAAAQRPTQTVRGTVIDQDTRQPLVGVTARLLGVDPLLGTVTDLNGTFRLDGVPVGRHDLAFSYVGYETRVLREVLVGSGKEVVLEVELWQSVVHLDELTVRPETARGQPGHSMATASVRLLGVEEASRYAGGFDDPARLAAAFAGVSGSLATNAIVVRGNAPRGLLWRLEGVEIPTPAHFANLLTFGGGGITALNSQMLADSDFYTGAFPAEYGNALSGVFDLRLRNGNNLTREHTFRLGTIGLDVGSEGPFLREGGASYLFNYRYSTFSLLAPLLPEDAGGISYQNLAFKTHAPTRRAGAFSLFALGAVDRSGQRAEPDPAQWTYRRDGEDVESPTRFGAVGLQHHLPVGTRGYVVTNLAASGNGLAWTLDRRTGAGLRRRMEEVRSETGKVTAASHLQYKFGPRHTNQTGIVVHRIGYRQKIRQALADTTAPLLLVDARGHSVRTQLFTASRFELGTRLTLTLGLHSQHFGLTGETTLEPRAGLTWRFRPDQSMALAYGRHTQTEVLPLYFAHPANRRLAMTRADHLVLGYHRALGPDHRLTVELYHQRLHAVPVIADSSFSVLNLELDWFLQHPLVNTGRGRNRGVDITFERYLTDGWYLLLTGSLFSARYRGGDGVWRPVRFDRRYVTSLLGGKEWTLAGPRATRLLSVNGRLNLMGGRRYAPVDERRSHADEQIHYDESRAFSLQEPPIVYADVGLEYRIDRPERASVWSLQVINLTGHREFYGYRYNLRERRIEEDRELILLPNLSYRLEF